MSTVGSSVSVSSARPSFLILCAVTRAGRKSATAAHITSTSVVSNASWTAVNISAAVSTRTSRVSPSGATSATGPVMSVVACPAATAAAAMA